MSEAQLVSRIKTYLEKEYPNSFWYKVHGGDYQEQGIPDLIGCVQGLFFGFEVKLPGKEGKLTKIQVYQIQRIQKAQGEASMITSEFEAFEYVDAQLEKFGLVN